MIESVNKNCPIVVLYNGFVKSLKATTFLLKSVFIKPNNTTSGLYLITLF